MTAARKPTLIVPDKDADGLASGVILQWTLVLLGLTEHLITVHLVQKGANIHPDSERAAIARCSPSYIFVLDQGSRHAPPVIDDPAHKALVIDHHQAETEDFPAGSQHITACHSPPVATTSLLTYLVCRDLHADISTKCDWLAVMGTHGDLDNSFKWESPFPDMATTLKQHTRKRLNDAVSLINAPRRTAAYDVAGAWKALLDASSPTELLANRTLLAARAEVNAEVERCTHVAPKFSADGRVAVLRIRSAAQVHPVIATRWAGHLAPAKLEIVLVANEGYLPGMVNFSFRVARCAKAKEPAVDIIGVLEEVANRTADPSLRERLVQSFARGHKQASGSVVPKDEFEELMAVLDVGSRMS